MSGSCSLIAELCRGFNAHPTAMRCAMRHGQITVDGYIMRPEFDRRWTQTQLTGRYARFHSRLYQLYGAKTVG